MSATRGMDVFFRISGKALTQSSSGTEILTISQPASSRACICSMVREASFVGVLVMLWIAIGLLFPILTFPMETSLVFFLMISLELCTLYNIFQKLASLKSDSQVAIRLSACIFRTNTDIPRMGPPPCQLAWLSKALRIGWQPFQYHTKVR